MSFLCLCINAEGELGELYIEEKELQMKNIRLFV